MAAADNGMMSIREFTVFALLLGSVAVHAQQATVPEPPPIPEKGDAPLVQTIEAPAQAPDDQVRPADVPDVTRRREGSNLIEEYRVHDRLVLMRVKPDHGPAYYLTDPAGDGSFREAPNDLDADFNLRKWKLGEW